MIPMLSGGAYRRPGTLNVDTLNISDNYAPRILPFIDSTNYPYCVLLGEDTFLGNYVKTYRATGNASGNTTAGTVTGSHPYNPATAGTWASTGITDDEIHQVQFCQSVDIMYLVHPNHKPYLISRTSLDHFTVAAFDAGLSGQAQVNAYPFLNQNTTATTLSVNQISSGGWAAGASVTITASAALFVSTQVGTIYVINYGSGTVGAFLVTGYTDSTHVTATVLVEGDAGTTAESTWWESAWSPTRGWPRSVCIFQQRLVYAGTAHQPDTMWFSLTADYAQMSVLGRPYLLPTTVSQATTSGSVVTTETVDSFTSVTPVYPVDDSQGDGFTTGPVGEQPFRITLSQNQLDQIQWLSPDKELLIGTRSQEWLTSPQNGSFDVANSPLVIQSKYGSDWVPAVRIGYELIFPMATQDELRAYQYNYIDASFFAEPIQLFFDQYPQPEPAGYSVGRRKIRIFDWDVSRQTLWCLDTAGNFFGMTRDRKLATTMWHTHQMGGFNSAQGQATIGSGSSITADPAYASCDGSVLSFAVVPNPLSGINDIWMVVKRTLSGVVNFQVERMIGKNITRNTVFSAGFPGIAATEPYLVDACVSQNDNGDGTFVYGSAGTSAVSLASLNGYAALTGNYYSRTTGLFKVTTGAVSAGSATLNKPVPSDYGTGGNWVVLGLMFNSVIQPVRIEAGSVIGTSQGAIKRINRCFVRFYKTLCAKIGSPPTSTEDTNALETIYFRDGTQAMGHSPELYTGDKKVLVPTTYDRDGYIYLEQDQPMPFTVVGIVSEGEEFD